MFPSLLAYPVHDGESKDKAQKAKWKEYPQLNVDSQGNLLLHALGSRDVFVGHDAEKKVTIHLHIVYEKICVCKLLCLSLSLLKDLKNLLAC